MLAIIETCGKQYEAEEGRYIEVELLEANKDDAYVFDKVVMIVDGKNSKVGQPYIEGATVKGKILDHGKDKKVLVYKQRCKKGYRKKQGHRQGFTKVLIESIEFASKKAPKAKAAEVSPVEEKTEE